MRHLRSILLGAGVLLAIPAVAQAYPGWTTGNVNMRTGAGVGYARITTIPANQLVQIYGCSTWCQIGWGGFSGWVSGNYVRAAGPGIPIQPPPPPPPMFGFGMGWGWGHNWGHGWGPSW